MLRLLLYPFSLLFGLAVRIRANWYAKRGWKSAIPTIVIGNLSTGGTGKTPHTLFIAEILLQHGKYPATLSRGYGRKTKGFAEVGLDSKAWEVGDEPLMTKKRYPELLVFVCESRVEGIKKIQDVRAKNQVRNLDCILLDDAFQHLALKPDLALVLLTYDSLQNPWILLPAGDGREPLSALERSHGVIVSKCPADMAQAQKEKLRDRIKRYTNSPLFFSTYRYIGLVDHRAEIIRVNKQKDKAILLAGIANPKPLIEWLKPKFSHLDTVIYNDHHAFTKAELQSVLSKAQDAFIIITEKDSTRIQDVYPEFLQENRVLVAPIQPDLGEDAKAFEKYLLNSLAKI